MQSARSTSDRVLLLAFISHALLALSLRGMNSIIVPLSVSSIAGIFSVVAAMVLISRILGENEPGRFESKEVPNPITDCKTSAPVLESKTLTAHPPIRAGESVFPKRRRVSMKRGIRAMKIATSTDSDDSEEYSEEDENRAMSTPRSRKRKVSHLLKMEEYKLPSRVMLSNEKGMSPSIMFRDVFSVEQKSSPTLSEGKGEEKEPEKTIVQPSDAPNSENNLTSTQGKPLLKLKNIVGASRPPMWFATMFPYLLCVSSTQTLLDPMFYIGLLYVSAPFNLYLCGLNDVRDWDVDHLSKKRASAWRQNLTRPQLDKLRRVILLLQLPFLFWMLVSFPTTEVVLFWIDASVQISLYNGFFGLPTTSRIPFVDLPMNVWAWHLPVHFYAVVNGEWLPLRFCVFWALQLCAGQILAAVHDIHNDAKCGKFTTATYLGKKKSIVTASVVWMLQSLWSLSMLGVHPVIGAVHFAFGLMMAKGSGHIKYAYPFGFMLDS